jgi:hypothetical protein
MHVQDPPEFYLGGFHTIYLPFAYLCLYEGFNVLCHQL